MKCSRCGESLHPTARFESALLHYLDHLTELLAGIRDHLEARKP